MRSVISESQSACVKDGPIIDEILIANEIVDETQFYFFMLFKVNFKKAYDFVDWRYLDGVMGKMAFPTLWRKRMKKCIGTTTNYVLVNGSPTDEFR